MVFYNTEKKQYFTIEFKKDESQVDAALRGVMQYLEDVKELTEIKVKCKGKTCKIYHTSQKGEDAITKQAKKMNKNAIIYKDGKQIKTV